MQDTLLDTECIIQISIMHIYACNVLGTEKALIWQNGPYTVDALVSVLVECFNVYVGVDHD